MGNDKYNVGETGPSYANGKTTFLIYNEATNTVESYVGIANVPTINLTDADDNCAVYVRSARRPPRSSLSPTTVTL